MKIRSVCSVIKTFERENLISMKKMPKKCSSDQSFIQERDTAYRIGTLAPDEFRCSGKPQAVTLRK